jgi:hypothetical protein
MTDTSFKLVKMVLDDLYGLIEKKHKTSADAKIRERLKSLSNEYTGLADGTRTPIDYSDPVTRFAYVYSYVAAHSAYVKLKLLGCDEVRTLLKSTDKVRVSCIGGGPGSELIGLLQASTALNRVSSLSVWLLDGEESWSETWSEVDERLEADFKLTSNSRQADVTSYKNFDNLEKAFSSDLFILSFFLSEIYSFRDNAIPFMSKMVESMHKGAMVLYIDNSSDSFTKYAESIFIPDAFEVLVKQTNEQLLPGSSEQTSDLEPYVSRFDRTPKVRSQATIRVWRKK